MGTTSVRTLESLYYIGAALYGGADPSTALHVPQWMPYEYKQGISTAEALDAVAQFMDRNEMSHLVGSTQIIIAPGYQFHSVGGMVTNFHQPQSTLLLLVSAFLGGNWRQVYDFALANDFRFLSYGDACLFL